jgi:hypothetical protein
MMRPSHARVGPCAWFTFSAATYLIPEAEPLRPDLFEMFAGSIIASSTSHGWLSPDVDGHRWLGKLIPGGHRGPLHMPDLVLAVGALLLWLSRESPAQSMVAALLCGWIGHVIADLAFGKVPFALAGGKRYGLTLDTDGFVERWIVRRLLLPLAVVSAAAALWLAPVGAVPAVGVPSFAEVAAWWR